MIQNDFKIQLLHNTAFIFEQVIINNEMREKLTEFHHLVSVHRSLHRIMCKLHDERLFVHQTVEIDESTVG